MRKFSVSISNIGEDNYALSCCSWTIVDGQRTEDVPPFNQTGYVTEEDAWAAFIVWKGE